MNKHTSSKVTTAAIAAVNTMLELGCDRIVVCEGFLRLTHATLTHRGILLPSPALDPSQCVLRYVLARLARKGIEMARSVGRAAWALCRQLLGVRSLTTVFSTAVIRSLPAPPENYAASALYMPLAACEHPSVFAA